MLCCWVESSFVFFFRQKTDYDLRISAWSSDVCSSDLPNLPPHHFANRCAFFFLGAVVDWENQRAAGRCVEDISQVIDQSLDFIITGFIGMNAHAGVLQ